MHGSDLKYKYINDNAPKEKIDYSYSEFNGEDFIDAWKKSRENFLKDEELPIFDFTSVEKKGTEGLLIDWTLKLANGTFDDSQKLNLLLKRFEVTRKIYESYDEEFRPTEKDSNFNQIHLYILFSYVLVNAYINTKKLYYLNSLLKVNDIIISNDSAVSEKDKNLLTYCFNKEVQFVEDLRKELI